MKINAYWRWLKDARKLRRRVDKLREEFLDHRNAGRTAEAMAVEMAAARLAWRPPLVAGADRITRQRRRAELRASAYERQRENGSKAPRAERRHLARALAAFRWKEERGLLPEAA